MGLLFDADDDDVKAKVADVAFEAWLDKLPDNLRPQNESARYSLRKQFDALMVAEERKRKDPEGYAREAAMHRARMEGIKAKMAAIEAEHQGKRKTAPPPKPKLPTADATNALLDAYKPAEKPTENNGGGWGF